MYLTYEEYVEFGGTLDVTTFSDLEFQASSIIDWYTFNRLHGETVISDRVKRLTFHLMKLAQLQQEALLGQLASSNASSTTTSGALGAITSQSNDGFSTTYNVISASEALKASDMKSDKVKMLVQSFLQGEKNSLGRLLLYRGLYPNE